MKFGINFTSCSENNNFAITLLVNEIRDKFHFCNIFSMGKEIS